MCFGDKEGAAVLSGQHHELSVGAGPSLQQQLPIIPRITGCSQLAGTGPWSPTLKQMPVQEQPPSLGVLSTLLSPALEALEQWQLPEAQGQWVGTARREQHRDSREELQAEHTPTRSSPRTAPPPLVLPSATWLPRGACECSFN